MSHAQRARGRIRYSWEVDYHTRDIGPGESDFYPSTVIEHAALLFLPVAACLGSVGFLIFPVLLIGSFLNTTDNGFSYSINQSAKEVLSVPTTRDEKYKAKAFIDMFIQRFAKAVAVGINLVIATWFASFENIRWLSLVTVAVLILWLIAARYAGRVFAEKERAASAATDG